MRARDSSQSICQKGLYRRGGRRLALRDGEGKMTPQGSPIVSPTPEGPKCDILRERKKCVEPPGNSGLVDMTLIEQ